MLKREEPEHGLNHTVCGDTCGIVASGFPLLQPGNLTSPFLHAQPPSPPATLQSCELSAVRSEAVCEAM